MNSLIRFIKDNTEERKRKKKAVDSVYKLSASNKAMLSASIRSIGENSLLDEGAIIEGDGTVWAYIKKGTLRKFLNRENEKISNLPADFVGNINIGHNNFVDWPFPVGQWTTDDMSLVDIGDGREGLNVDVKLDEDSIFIRELRRLGYELSLSVEMDLSLDYEASEAMGVPVIDEICIYEYAIVGDGKNVSSNGLMLKGATPMLLDEINELSAEEEIEIQEPAEDETEQAEEQAEEPVEESAEEEPENTEEDNADLEEEQLEEAEEDEEAEADEAESEEGESEEVDTLDEATAELNARIESLMTENAELKAQNSALKKSNRKLNAKLKDEKDKRDAFAAKVKNISVKLGVNEQIDEKPKRSTADYINGDGIKE